jgi:cell division septum initiation protein DivIVA
VTERVQEQGASVDGRAPALSTVVAEVEKRLSGVSAVEVRKTSLPRRRFGGYGTEEVHAALERAAQMVDDLLATVEWLLGRIEELVPLDERSPEAGQVVVRMLVTAERVVAQVKEEAQQEAAQVVDRAQQEAERAVALAQQEVRQAEALRSAAAESLQRAEAESAAIVAAATVERDRLIAEASGDAVQLRANLEADRVRLEAERERLDAEIAGLRGAWVERIGEALARLESPGDGAATAAGSEGAPEAPAIGPGEPQQAPAEIADGPVQGDGRVDENGGGDVVSDLRTRLEGAADGGE